MKLMLACTSGGHFATMNGLKPFWSQHNRVWMSDRKADTEALSDQPQVYWLPYQGTRDWWTFLTNLPRVCRIVARERPDLILSTGASLAVSVAIAAKLFGCRFVYVESISRSQDLSLSGQLVYYLADQFYVQWPGLCKKYPKAMFKGYAS